MSGHVVALCGGVGGAKLAHGLSLALAAEPDSLSIIVNTGDDFRHLGLSISPDLDSVLYALAGLSDPVRGWGRREETWRFMEALRGLGGESWFQLGDGDLAVHVERSWRLAQGATLSEVTAHLCQALGITARVLPMSDDPVRTRVLTPEGWLDFQDYFVRRQCQPAVREFMFSGAETRTTAAGSTRRPATARSAGDCHLSVQSLCQCRAYPGRAGYPVGIAAGGGAGRGRYAYHWRQSDQGARGQNDD